MKLMPLTIALEPPPIKTDAHGVVRVANTRVTLRHREEVNAYLAARQRQAAAIQQEVEQRFNPEGPRECFLARWSQMRSPQ